MPIWHEKDPPLGERKKQILVWGRGEKKAVAPRKSTSRPKKKCRRWKEGKKVEGTARKTKKSVCLLDRPERLINNVKNCTRFPTKRVKKSFMASFTALGFSGDGDTGKNPSRRARGQVPDGKNT